MTLFPEAVLMNHTSVIGKTGSGKTNTVKLLIEHVVEQSNAHVCVLDPIKSDYWGLISSADGTRPGLPFQILGGPHGHVPIHAGAGKAVGELVASGALPLSIIDMKGFGPGGIMKFFVDFAHVMLNKPRGVLYLVLEEAHLFAPKERAGFGDENMAVHLAKTLATAGRSMGLRLIVATQAVQSLHNALLGSCETLIAHRLTTPAHQDPIIKWLKANVDKELAAKIGSSLSSLKTGTGWMVSGEAKIAKEMTFPLISTYDNSATPTEDLLADKVISAPVDIERLRATIGAAVQEAEGNDPKKLKAVIAELQEKLIKSKAQEVANAGYTTNELNKLVSGAVIAERERVRRSCESILAIIHDYALKIADATEAATLIEASHSVESQKPAQQFTTYMAGQTAAAPQDQVVRQANTSASPTVRKILDVLHRASPMALSFEAAAARAGVSKLSSAYRKYRADTLASPEVQTRDDGKLKSAPGYSAPPGPGIDPIEEFASRLPDSYARMLRAIADYGNASASKERIAADAGISPTSSALGAGLRELMQLDLVVKDSDGCYSIHPDLR